MTISQTVELSQLVLSFECLNSMTFDLVQFPPTMELWNALRAVPIECIAFNDCVELGFYDDDRFVVPSPSNRRPLCCHSMVIRDVDHDTLDEFFDAECSPYFWPLRSLRNLMIHWNIGKRDYDRFVHGNITKLKERRLRRERRLVSKHSKRSSKTKKRAHRHSMAMATDSEYIAAEQPMSALPDLSLIETLFVSMINVNGFKSLLLFLSAARLATNLKMMVLRIPKNMNAAKSQLALNSDLDKMLRLLRPDRIRALRIEIVESSWISTWNVVNVVARHCADRLRTLQSLEIHLFDPTKAKRDRETKEMIVKIKDCMARMDGIGYLGLFVNASRHFDGGIVAEFKRSGFERESSELWFVKRREPQSERVVSHLEQYWEPHGIDPYA